MIPECFPCKWHSWKSCYSANQAGPFILALFHLKLWCFVNMNLVCDTINKSCKLCTYFKLLSPVVFVTSFIYQTPQATPLHVLLHETVSERPLSFVCWAQSSSMLLDCQRGNFPPMKSRRNLENQKNPCTDTARTWRELTNSTQFPKPGVELKNKL